MARIKHILLADDNDNDIKLVTLALTRQNPHHQIAVTRDGAEALDYLYYRGPFAGRFRRNPDVLLLDLKMPLVDGLEVLRQIKNDADLKTIPVVMLTSSREESDVLKSYQLGVNAYVVKPVDFKDFLQAIKETEIFWAARNESPPAQAPGPAEGRAHGSADTPARSVQALAPPPPVTLSSAPLLSA